MGTTDEFLNFISINLLVLGGTIWGLLGLTEYNWLSRTARYLNIPQASRIIYLMIGIATLIFLLKFYTRTILKPSLSESIIPPNLINLGFPLDYDQTISIPAPKSASYIIYWTTLGHEEIGGLGLNQKKAYGSYSNSGAIEVQQDVAKIKFATPTSYSKAGPHVHYRWLTKSGKLSPLYTIKV